MTLTTTTTTTGSQENKETMQARGTAIQNSNPDAILIMSTLDQQPPSCLLEGVPFWFQLAVSLLITFVGTTLQQVGVSVPSFAALVRSSPPMFTAKPSWGVRGILSKMQQTCVEHVCEQRQFHGVLLSEILLFSSVVTSPQQNEGEQLVIATQALHLPVHFKHLPEWKNITWQRAWTPNPSVAFCSHIKWLQPGGHIQHYHMT